MMALIDWKDEFKSGVPAVDEEHRELVDLINSMHGELAEKCSLEAVLYFLGEIHDQIKNHFLYEEGVMREIAYQGYDVHKRDHDLLLKEIRDIMESLEIDNDFDYASALSEKVARWFSRHFRTLDKGFHEIHPYTH